MPFYQTPCIVKSSHESVYQCPLFLTVLLNFYGIRPFLCADVVYIGLINYRYSLV